MRKGAQGEALSRGLPDMVIWKRASWGSLAGRAYCLGNDLHNTLGMTNERTHKSAEEAFLLVVFQTSSVGKPVLAI